MLISSSNLLANIGYVLFPDQAAPDLLQRRDELFFRLTAFRKDLKRRGLLTVSDGAIRGWLLHGEKSQPKRAPAYQFLSAFFHQSLDGLPEQAGLRKEYKDAISDFFNMHQVTDSLPASAQRGGFEVQIGLNQRPPRVRTVRNIVGVREKARSIVGKYQIIRPYLNRPDRYVLEAMSIYQGNSDDELLMIMYSHNHPDKLYAYTGEVTVSTRYAFSMLNRVHENDSEHVSVRCVALYTDSRRGGGGGYIERHCLSGLMIRGVRGDVGTQGPVAMPFCAIKIGEAVGDLQNPNFIKLHRSLYRLDRGSHIFVGAADNKRNPIFQACERIISAININIDIATALYTMPPDQVEDAVVANSKDNTDYELYWQGLTEEYLRHYDEYNAVEDVMDS